jgi:RNase P/RNase MRP subunit p29
MQTDVVLTETSNKITIRKQTGEVSTLSKKHYYFDLRTVIEGVYVSVLRITDDKELHRSYLKDI